MSPLLAIVCWLRGHDFRRHDKTLICSFCGKRVKL